MSNKNNDIIADRIWDEVSKMSFIREGDKLEYASKWLKAVIESEQPDVYAVKPPVYHIQSPTDEWMHQQEQNFINSFSE